ncbi:hypothetical protein TWF694_004109 [Orbilia ellipsospora]|uniref:Uncharacterized protein n=1 Tax=Orbilia ellipsospora TaxID=2528407 RepID=A0AAV9WX02_9PEZI
MGPPRIGNPNKLNETPTFTQYVLDDKLEPSPTPEDLRGIRTREEIWDENSLKTKPLLRVRHWDIPKSTDIPKIRLSDGVIRTIQPPEMMELRIIHLQPWEYFIQIRCNHYIYPPIIFNIPKIALRGFQQASASPLVINLWYTPSLCESNMRPQQASTHGGVICNMLETGSQDRNTSQVTIWLEEKFDPTKPRFPFTHYLQVVKGYRGVSYTSIEEQKPQSNLLFESERVYKKRWVEAINDEDMAYRALLQNRFTVKISLTLEPNHEDVFNITPDPNHDFGGIAMEEGQRFEIYANWKTFHAYASEMQAGLFNASGIFILTITNTNQDDLLRIEAPGAEFM